MELIRKEVDGGAGADGELAAGGVDRGDRRRAAGLGGVARLGVARGLRRSFGLQAYQSSSVERSERATGVCNGVPQHG